jgi:hypothetical protein
MNVGVMVEMTAESLQMELESSIGKTVRPWRHSLQVREKKSGKKKRRRSISDRITHLSSKAVWNGKV